MTNVDPSDLCLCGHLAIEHKTDDKGSSYQECEARGCGCGGFEPDEDEEEDDDDEDDPED